jgi:DNA-binding IclR family transcriptional regulator
MAFRSTLMRCEMLVRISQTVISVALVTLYMPHSTEKEGRTLKTVEKAFKVLSVLQEWDGAGVTELARAFDVTKGTMHTYLKTLNEEGHVVKIDDEYRVSLKLFEMGGRTRNKQPIYIYGRDAAEHLAEQTGELVHLGVEQRGTMYYIYRARGSNAMKTTTPVGHTRPIHATAGGKSILAALPDTQASTILDSCTFESLTKHTIDNRDEFNEELERVREHGYATNNQEEVIGSKTIAAAVNDPTGSIAGTVCLSGPSSRLQEEYLSELIALVKETANHIEVSLQRE